MDAKITKQRLSNMLSYDWLKILLVIVAAIAALSVLFTMVRTRPTAAQQYKVFGYGPVQYGEKMNGFQAELEKRFSYEILETEVEKISDDYNGRQVLLARRSVKEGSVVFVPDYTAKEDTQTAFEYLCAREIYNPGLENEGMDSYLNPETYFDDCKAYLIRFFGESWEAAEIDMDAVRESFMARNARDKRFRSAAKREAGIELEKQRLEQLREDYIFVRDEGLQKEMLPVVYYNHPPQGKEGEEQDVDRSYAVGISMSKLAGVKKIFYYEDADGNHSVEKLNLLLYDNGESTEFTRYETVSFLRYLLEKYATV